MGRLYRAHRIERAQRNDKILSRRMLRRRMNRSTYSNPTD